MTMYDSYFSMCLEDDSFVNGFGFYKPVFVFKRKGRKIGADPDAVFKEMHDLCEKYQIALDKEVSRYLEYLNENLRWYGKTAPELEQKMIKRQELQEELSKDGIPLSETIEVREALSEVSLQLTKINEKSRSVYNGIFQDVQRLKKRLCKSRNYHIKRISAFLEAAIGVNPQSEDNLRTYLAQTNVDTNAKVDKEVFEDIVFKDPDYCQVISLIDKYLGTKVY